MKIRATSSAVFTLPDGASMERTDQLMKRAEADLKSIPGVEEVLTTGGLNLLTNAYTSNNASIIIMLKPWEERHSKEEQLKPILAAARRKFAAYPEAVSLVFPPPPINGLGNASGFVFELQDKVGRTPQELAAAKDKIMQAMAKRKEITGIYSGLQHLRSADQARYRPRQSPHPQRPHQRRVPGIADLSRRTSGQRLQPLRPHLQSHAAGRTGLPQVAREHQRYLRPLQRQRHGARCPRSAKSA